MPMGAKALSDAFRDPFELGRQRLALGIKIDEDKRPPSLTDNRYQLIWVHAQEFVHGVSVFAVLAAQHNIRVTRIVTRCDRAFRLPAGTALFRNKPAATMLMAIKSGRYSSVVVALDMDTMKPDGEGQ